MLDYNSNTNFFSNVNDNKFNKNTVCNFLDVAKCEYNYIKVNKTEKIMDISLIKFPHKYDFKYEYAIKKILNFLKQLSIKLGLTEVNYTNDSEEVFSPVFKVKVPCNFDSIQLNTLWDEIFKEVIDFMENEEIDFLLDDMFIILHR